MFPESCPFDACRGRDHVRQDQPYAMISPLIRCWPISTRPLGLKRHRARPTAAKQRTVGRYAGQHQYAERGYVGWPITSAWVDDSTRCEKGARKISRRDRQGPRRGRSRTTEAKILRQRLRHPQKDEATAVGVYAEGRRRREPGSYLSKCEIAQNQRCARISIIRVRAQAAKRNGATAIT